jgi:hypothetical protein
METRRGLPGYPDDIHSRYMEASIGGMTVGCLYLPNGNPAPGPKFEYKLRWFDRLAAHAKTLLAIGKPIVLAGDYNVMPTDLDVYAPERGVDDAQIKLHRQCKRVYLPVISARAAFGEGSREQTHATWRADARSRCRLEEMESCGCVLLCPWSSSLIRIDQDAVLGSQHLLRRGAGHRIPIRGAGTNSILGLVEGERDGWRQGEVRAHSS